SRSATSAEKVTNLEDPSCPAPLHSPADGYDASHRSCTARIAERSEYPLCLADDLAQSFPRERRLKWASLLRRVFQIDVMRCASCGARMRVIAFIQDGDVSRRILEHLGWPAQVPPARPARAPPTMLSGSDAELVFDGLDNEPWSEP